MALATLWEIVSIPGQVKEDIRQTYSQGTLENTAPGCFDTLLFWATSFLWKCSERWEPLNQSCHRVGLLWDLNAQVVQPGWIFLLGAIAK